jgi:hypothetical protein
MATVVDEVRRLRDSGVRQVTLLGQNVNSYADFSAAPASARRARSGGGGSGDGDAARFAPYADGFRSVYTPRRAGAAVFAELLQRSAAAVHELVMDAVLCLCHRRHSRVLLCTSVALAASDR